MEHWRALKLNPTSALDDQIWSPQVLLAAYQALDSSLKDDKFPTIEGIRIWFAKNSRLVPDVSASKNMSLEPSAFPSQMSGSFTPSLPRGGVHMSNSQLSNFSPQTTFLNSNPMFLPSEPAPFRLPLQSTRPLPSLVPMQPPPKPEWRTSDTLPGLKVDIAQMVTRNQDLLCRSSTTSRRSSNQMVEEKNLSLPGSSGRQRSWTLPPPPPPPTAAPLRQQSSPLSYNIPLPAPSSPSIFPPDIERVQLEHLLAQKQLELEAFQLLMQQRAPRRSPELEQQINSSVHQGTQKPESKNESVLRKSEAEHKLGSTCSSSSSVSRSPAKPVAELPTETCAPSSLLLSSSSRSLTGTPQIPPPPPPPQVSDPSANQNLNFQKTRTQSLEYQLQDAHVRQLQNDISILKRSTSADHTPGSSPTNLAPSNASQIQQLEQQMAKLQNESENIEGKYQLTLVQQQLLDLKFGHSPVRSTPNIPRSSGPGQEVQSNPSQSQSVRNTAEISPQPSRKAGDLSNSSSQNSASVLTSSILQATLPASHSTQPPHDVSTCQDESKKNVSDRKKLRAAIKSSRKLIGAIAEKNGIQAEQN